ncbi:MAG TPA: RagB/SusD family nutrient uptake outer membrane protein [Saprospiraceae bacterium]|nr:RagB/SusD family nutrient uptake outer membrane protein [Saprospiraceae bacterium]
MKRTTYILSILLAIVFWCSSCTDLLDKEPLGRLDADSYFKTANDAIQAVNSTYGPLLINNTNNNFYWVFGTIASDDAIVGGDGSRPGITDIDIFNHTPATQELNDYWKLNYSGIVQANIVIAKTPLTDADETLKNRIIGEALFLRAYYHFTLAQVYGDVPLILNVQAPGDVLVSKTSQTAVYEQVAIDAKDAAALLPVSYGASDLGRATKGAALALKAKAHLYLKQWDQVVSTVADIKALGIYALQADYRNNFLKNTQNNSESVFEVQHANLELGVGNNLNQQWLSKKVIDGYGFAEVTPDFVETFEADDPRLLFTVARKNEPYFGTTYKASFSSTGASPRKFLQDTSEVSQRSDGDINYTAIRYDDVLLWEAEALAELGRTNDALAPLEEVRARARAQATNPATALPVITTTNKDELIGIIRHERRVELGFEFHRFFDLVRWGIAKDVLTGFEEGKNEVFPIPQTELDLNPNLVQNPGY